MVGIRLAAGALLLLTVPVPWAPSASAAATTCPTEDQYWFLQDVPVADAVGGIESGSDVWGMEGYAGNILAVAAVTGRLHMSLYVENPATGECSFECGQAVAVGTVATCRFEQDLRHRIVIRCGSVSCSIQPAAYTMAQYEALPT